MLVVGIGKRHQESPVGDTLPERENPLRCDRVRAPRTDPASLINEGCLPLSRTRSSCSRTMRPFGTPDCFDACSSQEASSFVRRMVIVLLICHKCNTGKIQVKLLCPGAFGNQRPWMHTRLRPRVHLRGCDTMAKKSKRGSAVSKRPKLNAKTKTRTRSKTGMKAKAPRLRARIGAKVSAASSDVKGRAKVGSKVLAKAGAKAKASARRTLRKASAQKHSAADELARNKQLGR